MDGFICAVGSGGTLTGISSYLKTCNPRIVVGCADPIGAGMFEFFTNGEAKRTHPTGPSCVFVVR